jgi:hypothetical protein
MACDTATHDREVAFRKRRTTSTRPENRLVQRGPTTVEVYLILKLKESLAGWKLLNSGSSLV